MGSSNEKLVILRLWTILGLLVLLLASMTVFFIVSLEKESNARAAAEAAAAAADIELEYHNRMNDAEKKTNAEMTSPSPYTKKASLPSHYIKRQK